MFIENALEGILKAAAWNGEIPVLPENITVDAEATSEWGGENRVFIYRESSRPRGDLTGKNDYSGWMESIISIVVLGRNKADSEWIKKKIYAVIRRLKEAKPSDVESLTINEGEELGIEPGEILAISTIYNHGTIDNRGTIITSLPEERNTLEIGGGEEFTLEEGEELVTERVTGDGLFQNLGVTRGPDNRSDYLLWLPFWDEIEKISSMVVKEVFAVERVEDGTFKAQYYNTIKMGFLHKVTI